VRANVLDIGSQWAQFAGWLHANNRQLSEANRLYGLALEWALEADKPDMIATALSMQGHASWLAGKPSPMIGLSRAAQRDNRASPGVRALAIQQEARGVALSGEAEIDDVDRKFDKAEELVAQAAEKPEDEPPWIYFFSSDYLILQRGLVYRLLGEYVKANELLTAGLSAIPEDMRQSDWVASHYLLQLAVNNAKAGDVGAACAVAHEINVIAQRTRLEGLRTTLIRFYKWLSQNWPNDPQVAELGEALR
jgi:tetratricopeptide (TPR) repeat protein